jgi:hypothetical protein
MAAMVLFQSLNSTKIMGFSITTHIRTLRYMALAAPASEVCMSTMLLLMIAGNY